MKTSNLMNVVYNNIIFKYVKVSFLMSESSTILMYHICCLLVCICFICMYTNFSSLTSFCPLLIGISKTALRTFYNIDIYPMKVFSKPPWRPTRPSLILHFYCQIFDDNKINSDGLGGFFGVSQTLKLDAEKRLRYKKFQFILILIFLTWFYNLHVYESSCLSITLSVQYNNELYKCIKLSQQYSRQITSPTRNIGFTKICVRILFILSFLSWLYNLLLLSGDIHLNPDPTSLSTATENSFSSSISHERLSNEPPRDKINNVAVRTAKTQISLGIRFLHVDSEDSDQTGRMPRLI